MTKNLPKYLTLSENISFDLSREISRLNPDQYAILVDENTKHFCLPLLKSGAPIIEIESGEENKTLGTCEIIWKRMTDLGFSRKSLIINLGGGVIGDMGGFAASTYKRGISFINIPTTLLSQVDASIGGKLGIDFGSLKNHLGIFNNPDAVIISTDFLKTLPERELKSGFAEIIKHALIKDSEQWEYLKNNSFEELDWEQLIPNSICIKHEVVLEDPLEGGLRKILNYGHTLGHAIESYYLHTDQRLLHGEAIAIGMLLENQLSANLGYLTADECDEISELIGRYYPINHKIPSFEKIEGLLIQDKKNANSKLSFSLLDGIGSCRYDVHVEAEMLRKLLK